jgi:hypothetical protein
VIPVGIENALGHFLPVVLVLLVLLRILATERANGRTRGLAQGVLRGVLLVLIIESLADIHIIVRGTTSKVVPGALLSQQSLVSEAAARCSTHVFLVFSASDSVKILVCHVLRLRTAFLASRSGLTGRI